MRTLLVITRNALRRISFILLPIFLIVILVWILTNQFSELATRNEILSLSSFITLLSFSALAFNWSRVSPRIASESLLTLVYQSGVDLFLASLLALIATFLAWLQINPTGLPYSMGPILFFLHWLFLFLSLLLFLISIFHLLHVAEQTGEIGEKKPHE